MELPTLPPLRFVNAGYSLDEADVAILGVPFDSTVSYRPGARFGPRGIREATWNLEDYILELDVNLATDIKISDCGDVDVIHGNLAKTIDQVETIVSALQKRKLAIGVLGGEHSMTYPVVKALSKKHDFGFIQFDAHFDLRDEYLGEKLSHATVMRRISEIINPENMVQIGIRSASIDEREFADKLGSHIFTMQQIEKLGIYKIAKNAVKIMKNMDFIYVNIDIDVLDPAFAPEVGCPEPGGLTTRQLLDAINVIGKIGIDSFDVVEVSPTYIGGITAVAAARVVFNILGTIAKNKS
ncbi:MAG: agmatinase [Euryarchaeota archaeon]|nr:agmatinase [Euryarchaeota archaeon]